MIQSDVYIANLKFNMIVWQIWFKAASDTVNPREKFELALKHVETIGPQFKDEKSFFEAATKAIESYGFHKQTHNTTHAF